MSEESSDGSLEIRRAPRTGAAAAAVERISTMSDDESDDDANRKHSQPISNTAPSTPSDTDLLQRTSHDDIDAEIPLPEREATPVDSHVRSAGMQGARAESLDMFHFPPTISFPTALTTSIASIPVEQNPILYRVKPGMQANNKSAVEILMDAYKKDSDIMNLKRYLQSNANLITWSDGSKTIAIGSQQFLLIEDAMASKHYVFRKGDKVQTYEAKVKSVARVQPSSTRDARTKFALANAAANKAVSKRPPSRTMLRCMDDDAEQQEAQAKIESHRKERERARLEAKRRQARERHARPSRPLTVETLESDEDDEDAVRQNAERAEASERLMKAKRPPSTSRSSAFPVKRRKAGGRRVVDINDDDSESD